MPIERLRCWLNCAPGMCAVLLVVGCYPVGELQGPRVMRPGQVRVGVAGGVTHYPRRDEESDSTDDSYAVPVATTAFGVRVGVAEGVDLGVRLTPFAGEVGAKFQVVRAHTVGEWDVSIAPAGLYAVDSDLIAGFDDSVAGPPSVSILAARFPVFVGVRVSKDVEPWIAVTPQWGRRYSSHRGHDDPFFALGGAVGVDLRTPGVIIQPQFALLVPLVAISPWHDREYDTRLAPGDVRLNFALNFLSNEDGD